MCGIELQKHLCISLVFTLHFYIQRCLLTHRICLCSSHFSQLSFCWGHICLSNKYCTLLKLALGFCIRSDYNNISVIVIFPFPFPFSGKKAAYETWTRGFLQPIPTPLALNDSYSFGELEIVNTRFKI